MESCSLHLVLDPSAGLISPSPLPVLHTHLSFVRKTPSYDPVCGPDPPNGIGSGRTDTGGRRPGRRRPTGPRGTGRTGRLLGTKRPTPVTVLRDPGRRQGNRVGLPSSRTIRYDGVSGPRGVGPGWTETSVSVYGRTGGVEGRGAPDPPGRRGEGGTRDTLSLWDFDQDSVCLG